MIEDNEDKKLLKELKDYLLKAEGRVKYSLERLDLLIISLSSGGLVLALNLFKSFKDDSCVEKEYLSLSWLFFFVITYNKFTITSYRVFG